MRRTLLLSFLVVLSAAAAFGAKPSTAPGKYKEWGPDIDEIEIVKTFKIADYDHIVVRHFDTSKTPLPDEKARWYGTLKAALAGYDAELVQSLSKELKAKAVVDPTVQTDPAPRTPKTLIIRGTVLEMDPGSRGGRYFGGFGAGAAYTRTYGEVVDAASGEVLLRFTQARRSAGSFKIGGGSDLDVLRDTVHATGQDVAHILDLFQ